MAIGYILTWVDGTLDPVFDYKARIGKRWQKKKSTKGTTQRDIKQISKISTSQIQQWVQKEDGTTAKAEYKYVGYKILTYKKGTAASATYSKLWTQ